MVKKLRQHPSSVMSREVVEQLGLLQLTQHLQNSGQPIQKIQVIRLHPYQD